MKVYDLKETLTLMKSALQEPDTHAADIETVREKIESVIEKLEDCDQATALKIARNALAALDRLEGQE